MASRASLNKVLLIGNLTRDPELRYTPSGASVCTFGLATNRTFVSSDGTKKEETEFHKVVSWNKLAELCSKLLTKGRKVYVEGRLSTRTWETPDGQNRQFTEIVIDDMRILDSRKDFAPVLEVGEAIGAVAQEPVPAPSAPLEIVSEVSETKAKDEVKNESEPKKQSKTPDKEIDLDDLPF